MTTAANRTLAFLGFGKKPAAGESEGGEGETDSRKVKKATTDEDDDDDDLEDDEREDEGDDDDREAAVRRNRLRAAGDLRGRKAERARIAAIMNGVDPAKAEQAMHFAVNTDLTPDQAKAALAKAPAGGKANPFATAMAAVTDRPQPSFGADRPAGSSRPTLAGRMSADLKKRGWIK